MCDDGIVYYPGPSRRYGNGIAALLKRITRVRGCILNNRQRRECHGGSVTCSNHRRVSRNHCAACPHVRYMEMFILCVCVCVHGHSWSPENGSSWSPGFSSRATTRFTFVVFRGISRQPRDGLSWHWIRTFMSPTGWIARTLLNPWPSIISICPIFLSWTNDSKMTLPSGSAVLCISC